MSFGSVMKKIGKVALTASPYIAAPFTGGASLMLAPATQMAANKWSQHDAEENIKKGIAPSSFDKYLGMAGDIASIAAPTGALGAFGKIASTGGKVGGIAGALGKTATIANAGLGVTGVLARAAQSSEGKTGQNTSGNPSSVPGGSRPGQLLDNPSGSAVLRPGASMPFPGGPGGSLDPNVVPRGGYSYNQNPLNQVNQNNPNLSMAMGQGRAEALENLKRRSIFTPQSAY